MRFLSNRERAQKDAAYDPRARKTDKGFQTTRLDKGNLHDKAVDGMTLETGMPGNKGGRKGEFHGMQPGPLAVHSLDGVA